MRNAILCIRALPEKILGSVSHFCHFCFPAATVGTSSRSSDAIRSTVRWGRTNADEQELVPTVGRTARRGGSRMHFTPNVRLGGRIGVADHRAAKVFMLRLRVQIFLEPRPTTSSPERIA